MVLVYSSKSTLTSFLAVQGEQDEMGLGKKCLQAATGLVSLSLA